MKQTLSLFMFPDTESPTMSCGLDPAAISALRPAPESGWDIGSVGVSHLVLEELATTPIDSMIRVRQLSDFFKFNIDDCEPLACSITVRTFAEDRMYHTHRAMGSTRPQPSGSSKNQIREIGREEALRLYAELSCFARARSYTVWPRSGETKRALVSSSSQFSMLGDLMSGVSAGGAAKSTRAAYTETQHVFGIGDGGRTAEDSFVECDAPFYWMLDNFEPNGEFVQNFVGRSQGKPDPRKWDGASPAIRRWRDLVVCRIAQSRALEAWKNANCYTTPPSIDDLDEANILAFATHVGIHDFMILVREQRDYDTNVSWLVVPEQDSMLTPKRHVAKSVPLSAIISLPSWWPSANITIRTCWMRPKTMMQKLTGADFCRDPADKAQGTGTAASRNSKPGRTESTVPVKLPSNAQDVLQKLGFFIIRAPYLDNQSTGQGTLVVQAGRPAAIRLTGKRLWKNPRVRLGNQWHDEIEVLPDMKGIIARFKCVQPTSDERFDAVDWRQETLIDIEKLTELPDASVSGGPPPGQGGGSRPVENRMARVWTSEGATSFADVSVRAFRPAYVKDGVHERPCWPDTKNRYDTTEAAVETTSSSGTVSEGEGE